MKVLYVAECIGGVDRYLRCLLKYSTCENILILSQLYKREDYKKLADHIEIMHMTHKIGFCALKEAHILRKKIKKYRPDVVYAHSSIAGALTRMACIGINVKVIYNPHGWSFNMKSRMQNAYVVLERVMAHFCDAIICISEAEKQSALREKICKEDKLHVIYNGIDIEEYKNEKVELAIPEHSFVIGMVGRICKQKAPDIFVKMANVIQKQMENAYFVIVGDVVEGSIEGKKEIEDMAEKFGVKLLITGWVTNPLAYMSRFNVGCLLSRWEGFGLAIPEYMLTGTPIVATRVDAIPYLIQDNVNGLLVDMDDWRTAADKVVELSKNNKKREELIRNGMETVRKRFDAKRVSAECENLYNALAKNRE
ncbi:glycosyltransferase [Clostridium sp. BIOML-A1]|uniref:glycosyltransferase n=1 Tax=Clostridium sp. BIOML-A1 TaxID=2584627 RepID=UPI00136ED02A|nr:glycosyltransferase [Clostridium sp. BIOML-A1]